MTREPATVFTSFHRNTDIFEEVEFGKGRSGRLYPEELAGTQELLSVWAAVSVPKHGGPGNTRPRSPVSPARTAAGTVPARSASSDGSTLQHTCSFAQRQGRGGGALETFTPPAGALLPGLKDEPEPGGHLLLTQWVRGQRLGSVLSLKPSVAKGRTAWTAAGHTLCCHPRAVPTKSLPCPNVPGSAFGPTA